MVDIVANWLEQLGLGQYAEVFAENAIVWEHLPDLDHETLLAIGVKAVGHRMTILKTVAALSVEQSDESATDSLVAELSLASWERHPDERKPATILFADITGSTALTEHLDAEDTHDILEGARRRMCAAVSNNRGIVCKVMGDGVMALFGAPVSREHHAVEACEAALEMQQAVRDYGRQIEARHEVGLKIRVGLHSGEIVVLVGGEGDKVEYDADGPAVPIAARMEQSAEPGTVYMTAATQSLADNRIETEALAPVFVKGISDPVPVFLLLRVRSIDEALTYATRTPFVGRRAELNQFKGVLDTCIEEGYGQTVYVRGEPGIGKTRLVEEITKIADAKGTLSLRGLVLPFGVGKGQDVIRALVQGFLGIPPGSDKNQRQTAAETAVRGGRLEPEQTVFLNDLLDIPQPTELRIVYDAMDNDLRNAGKQKILSALVTAASNIQPTLVIVEDVHWADALTLAHLSTLAKAVAECPALLVMTSRIDGDQLDQSWRTATAGSPFISIDLAPLRKQEAIALIGEFIDTSDALSESCLERAAGNPLFLEQLLRNAKEGATENLPDSIQSLVLARMDRLAIDDKKALQAASIMGQRFDAEVLRSLLDTDDYDCRELIAHNLVRPDGSGFLFTHALIQESVYSSLVKSQRRELHGKAARWFANSDSVLRAEHLGHGGDESAPRAFLEAAQQQADLYRFEWAAALVKRGLELTTDQDRFPLQCLQGGLLRSLGLLNESIEIYRVAKESATTDIDRCRASLGIAEGLRITEAHDELLEELQFAEAIANEHNDSLALARIYQLRGGTYFIRGETTACIESNKAALQYAESAGSPEIRVQALSGLGDAEYVRGRMISAYRYFDQCIAISREQGLGQTLAANLAMRGFTSRWQNKFIPALSDFGEALSLSEETGQYRAELVALGRGECFLDIGNLDEGERLNQRRLALARRLCSRSFEGVSLIAQSRVAHLRGCSEKAEKLAKEAVETLREGGMAFGGAWALGMLALTTKHPDTRRSALSEGEDLLHGNSVSHNFMNFYLYAIETCLQTEQWSQVNQYAQKLAKYTRAEPLPYTDFFIAHGRALAAFGRGSRDVTSARELQRLLDEAKRLGFIFVIPALDKALSST